MKVNPDNLPDFVVDNISAIIELERTLCQRAGVIEEKVDKFLSNPVDDGRYWKLLEQVNGTIAAAQSLHDSLTYLYQIYDVYHSAIRARIDDYPDIETQHLIGWCYKAGHRLVELTHCRNGAFSPPQIPA